MCIKTWISDLDFRTMRYNRKCTQEQTNGLRVAERLSNTIPTKVLQTICWWCVFHVWRSFSCEEISPINEFTSCQHQIHCRGGRKCITRNGGKLTTSIHRKKTFSGVYVNYNSFFPRDYKRCLISTLVHPAYTICSDYDELHQEIGRLKTIWQKIVFPSRS